MNELKKRTLTRVKDFVDKVFDEADEAEAEERYINKTVIGKGLNELYSGLDQDFLEAGQRVKPIKKGWG